MPKRAHNISRKTNETKIQCNLIVDGRGQANLNTGIPFFDHMLDLLTKHGNFDLDLTVDGDIEVDYHHSVEDVGICLGTALREALGIMEGIERYASGLFPMDEALCQIAIDISNRPHLSFKADLPKSKVGEFDVELTEEFLTAFVNNARITCHIHLLEGKNLHHCIEACFKALGNALHKACSISPSKKGVPSTKGVL